MTPCRQQERERLKITIEHDLFWVIGRIEMVIKQNDCMRSELGCTLPYLNRIANAFRSTTTPGSSEARK